MARVRTVEFLPEIFQTPVNRQFLNATLDQLTQESAFQKTQGFVGRKIGPGVNATDRYVIEPTTERNNYQLEPGVVSLDPGTNTIQDAITYPGINSALALQGAKINNADRLYTSDYYTWDPFVDFDKFVNYSQYYWLPAGPDAVDVASTGVPLTDNFIVTRANGVYTFSGISGTNPILTLARGGNYTFQVSQNATEDVNFRVTNRGNTAYVIDFQDNPALTLVRGNTYTFALSLTGIFPFFIKTQPTLGTTNQYNSGVTNNGAATGTITFTVPQDAPDTLYYVNPTQFSMQGVFTVVNGTPGTGPGFFIQTDPGVSGRIPATPNISSRDVLGVVNNGEDLGTVTFNVPLSTAQDFFYTLPPIATIPGKPAGTVDLVTNLKFNQINNQFVTAFLEANPTGIDGITDLNGKTIVFLNNEPNAQAGGWQITTQYDPLPNNASFNGQVGSYDTTTYDQTTDITSQSERYSVWQIQYVTTEGGGIYIQLVSAEPVNNLEKFSILFGAQYASTQWYKNSAGFFEQIPLLTAIRELLFYQDGTDPEIFGQIRLIDQGNADTIFISDIVGKKNYTSPNGVVFTNGLKVVFRGAVEPASFQNQEYYVEGVGTAIKLLPVANFVTPETYTQSSSVPYDSTPWDVGNYDATLNAPEVPDYVTINRASPDLNAWTRSNRWFHIDVITASAEYNNTIAAPDNRARARRPILEFRTGTRLFNFGTQGKQPVNIIDFAQTDALSNINGSTGYGTDGYTFIEGTRVIFAADTDSQVRNKIYEVTFIVPDTVPPLIAQPVINLVPASDALILPDQTTVCLSGSTLQGQSFWFDGVAWTPPTKTYVLAPSETPPSGFTTVSKSYIDLINLIGLRSAQDKTQVNQPPLFDVYDSVGISFSNQAKYLSSNFTGSKLFSYATSNLAPDPVLGFPLRYLSLANVGDIVFDNNLYADTFAYVTAGKGVVENISQGFVRQYENRVDFTREIGWQPGVTTSVQRQQFQFAYDGSPLLLDVRVNANTAVPAVQVYVNSTFEEPANYTYTTTNTTTTITLSKVYAPGDVIEVAVLSDQISSQAFYQIPVNLENNPLNANSETFTLGTVRSHYQTIGENLLSIQGPIIGANNTRDLGNIIPYGLQILQQSSPLTLAGYFVRDQEYDIFASLEYNSREYVKFKNLLLETVIRNEYGNMTAAEILDAAIYDITQGRTNLNPFYWSDMLPTGAVYTQTTTPITPITPTTFNTIQTYNFTSANYHGLLVYVSRPGPNQTTQTLLLTRGTDYTVSTDSPQVTIITPLITGDTVIIREYATTAGNFCPNTPTKLGLYPKWVPQQFVDTNYVEPTVVIQGHDGSITVAFNDIRDEVLLEFERRIYNNLKTDNNPVPLTAEDVIPGFFRTTNYSQTEVNDILNESFLTWVGWNKLNYTSQTYNSADPFTYNYSSAGNKINSEPLQGAWRGIYQYFYDTTSPNLTPWEMLGLSEQPVWWEDRYGPAPYTSDNLVLWDDLELGLVTDPVAPYIRPQYARPGLTQVIPVGTEGQLLAPINSVVGPYDPTAFRKSWVPGDGGPVQAAWWTSSSYPFAVMRLLALTRPAEFFSLFADRDLYRFDEEFGQYLYQGRYRLTTAKLPNQPVDSTLQIYGNGVSKASYINWIVDYNQQLGQDSTTELTTDLSNVDVRLCYRLASFTDKQYLRIFVERSSPNSTNSSLLLPDDSYKLLLYKNQPFAKIVYSGLIVERTPDGYSVWGYNNATPYFNILASSSNGLLQTVSGGGAEVRVPAQYTTTVVQVPYGYTFTNTTTVVDFILSYGQYLQDQGLIFDDQENGYTLNWSQMATEFLYFSQQGWATGTLINLNPSATTLRAFRAGAVVDTIISTTPENLLLDQNRQTLPTRDLIINREGNAFEITSPGNQTISFLNLKFTNYENIVILDNVSIFNDLIYDPTTGARQNRVRITASTTTDWDGTLDARGFILNDNATIREWQANRKYTKGEIVLYKNNYWAAQTIVQPKREFNYTDWIKSDYTEIQGGLLPNIANKADQLANSYNTQVANLERDNDLLSYGLIGFRERQYMVDLNLDDVSQVNLYQQFLPTKGTRRAAQLFTNADLGKETGQYNIYENWGVLVSTYGATANRSFIELRLNEADLTADPATVQVIFPQQPSQANQTILLSNVWRESFKLTSTDILPTTFVSNPDTALPTAGYVNIDDVDLTVFSLDDPSVIAANLETIGIGTTIWAAKSNSYDWNVYRCSGIPGRLTQITDNLNGTSIAQFNQVHGLAVGDLIVIRYFSTAVDGVYRVLSTPSITSITIAFTFVNTNQSQLVGSGLAFYLQTQRVAQASDVANLPYVNSLIPGALAYVDNDGTDHWQVLQKQSPFSTQDELILDPPVVNTGYGTSVVQTEDLRSVLIGAPLENASLGTVYLYGANENSPGYTPAGQLSLTTTGTVGYGEIVTYGQNIWSAVGAPRSLGNFGYVTTLYKNPVTSAYSTTQLLTKRPGITIDPAKFGTSVTISLDERWMYVGAPGDDNGGQVYAYGRVDVESPSVSYGTDGTTNSFNWSNSIVVDLISRDTQLIVTVENVTAVEGEDYVVSTTNVIFITPNPPPSGQTLKIQRRTGVSFTGDGSTENYPLNPWLYTATNINAFTVRVNGLIQRPYIDYKFISVIGSVPNVNVLPAANPQTTLNTAFPNALVDNGVTDQATGDLWIYDGILWNNVGTITGTEIIIFTAAPSAGASIEINAGNYWQACGVITVDTELLPATANFGISLATSTDGRQIIVGADRANPITVNMAVAPTGAVYVYDRSVTRYLVTDFAIINPDSITATDSQVTFNFATQSARLVVGSTIQITGFKPDGYNGQYQIVASTPTSITITNSTVEDVVDFGQIWIGAVYDIPGTPVAPVAVVINGEFLSARNITQDSITKTQFINGQVDINYDTNKIILLRPLTVGDNLEIETNQFQLVQKVIANQPGQNNQFGHALDICSTNCSLYVGSPQDSSVLLEAGSAERNVNQSRVYGVTTSLVANPVLVAGSTIRINNIEVAVPASPNNTIAGLVDAINSVPYISTEQYYTGDRVSFAGTTYVATQSTSDNPPTINGQVNTLYWNISPDVPNVTATLLPNLEFLGDGNTKQFNVSSIYNADDGYTTVVYVDNVLQTDPADYQDLYNPDPPVGPPVPPTINFTTAPAKGSVIVIVSGRMTVSVKNFVAATTNNRLAVLPGPVNSAFSDLGFETFVYAQTITSPAASTYARFGSTVSVDTSAVNLIVGAPNGNIYEPMTFDDGATRFDDRSTTVFNPVFNSGVAYTYDFLPSVNGSVQNPGKFVFGQQIYDTNIGSFDQFGTAINYTSGQLLVGAPGYDGTIVNSNVGLVAVFANPTNTPAWAVIRQQQPVVDVNLINTVFMYDKLSSSNQTYFDFFDPLQGKILGAARRNIDYIGAVDPANYNTGTVRNQGNSWGAEREGKMWWDTDTVRFIDPNQDDIVYASRRWGQVFPGSRVDVYQWTASSVPPVNYTGPGIPLSTVTYSVRSSLNLDNIFVTTYYFWVRGINTINTAAGKTLSPTGVARYIESPRTSGIPYIAALNSSTVAIYNGLEFISAADTILHIGYDREFTDANIHTEYQFVADGQADSFLNATLYRKLQDSFCGVDIAGAQVPDILLSPAERYGVQFRPRQSMFANRFAALQNYLTRANDVLKLYPVAETKNLSLLNSSEPEPSSLSAPTTVEISIASPAVITWPGETISIDTPVVFSTSGTLPTGLVAGTTYYVRSTISPVNFTVSATLRGSPVNTTGTQTGVQSGAVVQWNQRLATIEELGYQNLGAVPLGYLYLVESDTTQFGYWDIYQVIESDAIAGTRTVRLTRIQNYFTPNYWYYIDWYLPGYNRDIQPITEVPVVSALDALNRLATPVGSSVKVTANAQGKFEIYVRTELGWDRVALQDGTLQFREELWNYGLGGFGFDVEPYDTTGFGFDREPVIETRKIIQAINEQLFVDDLAIERNRSLILMFNYIYSEFTAPEWLVKTSLIDVEHRIRGLLPFQTYLQDNQDFVLDYIQEVKPYHVQIREFNLSYNGQDDYPGMIADFDVPAYWKTQDIELPQFVSPVLQFDQAGLPYTPSNSLVQNTISDAAPDAEIWALEPWTQWYNNYLLELLEISVIRPGTGYTVAPQVFVNGVLDSNWTAIINSAGQVISVETEAAEVKYVSAPVITLVGGNGTGALAIAVMGNSLVRSIRTTIKYDRCDYVSTIVDWQANVIYVNGTQVRYLNRVWQANSGTSNPVVGPTFDPAQWILVDPNTLSGADRTMGYYTPTVNMPGLSLPLLIDGIDYPGVQVSGVSFDVGPGFDGASRVDPNFNPPPSDDPLYVGGIRNVTWSNQAAQRFESPDRIFTPQEWCADRYIGGAGFDTEPWDNLAIGPEGLPTYDPAILDTIYESYYPRPPEFPLPVPTGLAATDLNIEGGGYVDVYSSHAPEELIPGAIFDTLDMRVFSRPGSDWVVDGHGFPLTAINYTIETAVPVLSFGGAVPVPNTITVTNQTLGILLDPGVDYTIDWVNQTVTITGDVFIGQVVTIDIYGLGGGNQLLQATYTGDEVGNRLVVEVNYNEIQEFAIFVNGALTTNYVYEALYTEPGVTTTYESSGSSGTTLVVASTQGISVGSLIVGTGFASGQTVSGKFNETTLIISSAPDSTPSGLLTFKSSTGQTVIDFATTYTATDFISLTAIGPTLVNDQPVAYSWSTAQIQTIISPGPTLSYLLTNSVQFSNPDNLIVTVNGTRARTSAGAEWYGDGSTEYLLPDRLGFSQALIADTDVRVYIDDIPQTLGTDFTVEPFSPTEARGIVLSQEPPTGSRILICVITGSQCYVTGSELIFVPGSGINPVAGSVIQVITWNDTRQQNILTKVYVGPVTTGITVQEPYDSTDYDTGTVNNDPGSYDFSGGLIVTLNDFQLGRPNIDPNRLWVTLNGARLLPEVDFTVVNDELILNSGVIHATDVVMISEFTNSVVPPAMAFRIFQDMQGFQLTYRITPATTTFLTQALTATADIVHVADASALTLPVLSYNQWGVLTVNGERIMYRERDLINNTVSSLIRGTAGTAAAEHAVDSTVYNMSRSNLLPTESAINLLNRLPDDFQNYVVSDSILANGVMVSFEAPSVNVGYAQPEPYDWTTYDQGNVSGEPLSYDYGEGSPLDFIEVYLGGIKQFERFIGNGITTTFALSGVVAVADSVVTVNGATQIENVDYTITETTLTFVIAPAAGSTVQVSGYTLIAADPTSKPPKATQIQFETAPPAGILVTILVRRGVWWYNIATPAEREQSLQESANPAARFLRGQ